MVSVNTRGRGLSFFIALSRSCRSSAVCLVDRDVPASHLAWSQETTVDVLWEDATAMVINKPWGLLTTITGNHPSLEAQLVAWLSQRERSQREGSQREGSDPQTVSTHRATAAPFVRMPHRLDRAVSGAVLVARTARAAKVFSAQFEARKIEKRYLAWVAGVVSEASGTWRDTIRKVPNEARAEVVDADAPDAKLAVLHFEVRQRLADRTLLEVQLETGRMHQIRLQTALRHHPILGDRLYGSQIRLLPESPSHHDEKIALHAHRIGFRHPQTALPITVDAPVAEDWPQPFTAA